MDIDKNEFEVINSTCCVVLYYQTLRGIFITSLMSAVDDITADHMITLCSTSIL